MVSPLGTFSARVDGVFSRYKQTCVLVYHLSLSDFVLTSGTFSDGFTVAERVSSSRAIGFSKVSVFDLGKVPLLLCFRWWYPVVTLAT